MNKNVIWLPTHLGTFAPVSRIELNHGAYTMGIKGRTKLIGCWDGQTHRLTTGANLAAQLLGVTQTQVYWRLSHIIPHRIGHWHVYHAMDIYWEGLNEEQCKTIMRLQDYVNLDHT